MAKIQVGLDIGTNSAKISAIEKRRGNISLTACGIKDIPPNSEFDDWVEYLKKLRKESGISQREVKISVSGSNIITRYVMMPVMPKKALINSLKFEFDKYIPFPMNECIVDFDILDKVNNKMNVLIISAKKYYIEERIRLIRQSGLAPLHITVDSLALHKAFSISPYMTKNDAFIILNIGTSVTNLVIINNGISIFSRDINTAGNSFTKAIAEEKGISFSEADKLKKTEEDFSSLNQMSIDLNSLINETSLSIEYAKKSYRLNTIKAVYIGGGSSRLTGIKERLEEGLGVKVDFWNPFIKIGKNKQVSKLVENSYQKLVLSLGIALS